MKIYRHNMHIHKSNPDTAPPLLKACQSPSREIPSYMALGFIATFDFSRQTAVNNQ
jgi:hypothetical protein